jgi:hypothetical protein
VQGWCGRSIGGVVIWDGDDCTVLFRYFVSSDLAKGREWGLSALCAL